ncbi:hypothetical protein J6590_099386, partial [Homalodisca vitripennis]
CEINGKTTKFCLQPGSRHVSSRNTATMVSLIHRLLQWPWLALPSLSSAIYSFASPTIHFMSVIFKLSTFVSLYAYFFSPATKYLFFPIKHHNVNHPQCEDNIGALRTKRGHNQGATFLPLLILSLAM